MPVDLEPDYPGWNPGWEDDGNVPLSPPPQVVYEDDNGDDSLKVDACAAVDVAAAIIALIIVAEYRKR